MSDQPKPFVHSAILAAWAADPEAWKPIAGYEGSYEVSDQGRVRSVDRVNSRGNRLRGRLMSLTPDGYGYLRVKFHFRGKGAVKTVHRLVVEAFIPPGRPDQTEVNHIDGDKTNNAVGNLEWASPKENIAHAMETGLSDRVGEANGRSKLTETQALEIYRLAHEGDLSLRKIADQFGVVHSVVANIKFGRKWAHVTGANEQ